MKVSVPVAFATGFVLALAFRLSWILPSKDKWIPPQHTAVSVQEALSEHSHQFDPPRVLNVADGVYVAIGFGLANSILLETDDCLVVVDTLESHRAGLEVRAAFEKISRKPFCALIYTHNHADHVFGSAAFGNPGEIDVYSHESTLTYLDRVLSTVNKIIYKRSMRQFGVFLDKPDHVNSGIGPRLRYSSNETNDVLRPTKTFSDRLSLKISNLRLELVHCPGETNDQIVVWLPDQKILLAADNFYRAFPNLYAIRGTPHRDLMEWVRSLDKMRAFDAHILIPSHTQPIHGRDSIKQVLTTYRDAVQFVHDQTVRWMNLGLTPSEIVQKVALPQELYQSPYLQQFYGTVEWSVRSVFSGYLGWFSGDAAHLNPLPPKEEAHRMASLVGGRAKLFVAAKASLDAGDLQWALQLSTFVLQSSLNDKWTEHARQVRIQALRGLGSKSISANARNYYLTQALEAEGLNIKVSPDQRAHVLQAAPMEKLFRALAVNLRAESAIESNTDTAALFFFPDLQEYYKLHVRRGIADTRKLQRVPDNMKVFDLVVEVDSKVWRESLANRRRSASAFATGEFTMKQGSLIGLGKLLLLFRPSEA